MKAARIALVLTLPCYVQAQTAEPKALAAVRTLTNGLIASPVSGYDVVDLLKAWEETADGRYFKAAQASVDRGDAPVEAVAEVDRVLATKKYDGLLADMQNHPRLLPKQTELGAKLLAATEAAEKPEAGPGRGKRVVVDAWFNSQTRPTKDGGTELFHYKWDDEQNSGFSFFGRAFQRFGAQLGTLKEAPTVKDLKEAQVYIIASPDIPSKNPDPHYMDKASGDAIEAWVKAGGVLILLSNDKDNTEFEHFNTLSERFGIHFNPVLRNTVDGNHYEQGRLDLPAGTGEIFPEARTVYMKEICTITPSGQAKAIFTDKGDVLMAVAHFGKGVVFATVDPWLYNEYTDGRKLPPEYQNFPAAIDLARWSLRQTK